MLPSSYLLVYEKLKKQIDYSELLPGDSLKPEKVLAEEFKVSRTTLRKALSKLENENLIVRRPGIGNIVCSQALPPTTRQETLQIGVEVDSLYSEQTLPPSALLPFGAETGIGDMSRSGWPMQILSESHSAAVSENVNLVLKDCRELYDGAGLDAAIFTLVQDGDYSKVAQLAKRMPVILINRITDIPTLSYIAVDYRNTVYRIIRRLLLNGCRNVAFIGGASSQQPYAPYMREQGYRQAFADSDLDVREELILSQQELLESNQLPRLLVRNQPDVVFVSCKGGMVPVFAALESVKKEMKKPVYLICFDDVSTYEYLSEYPVSGIAMPFRKMARCAIQYLAASCREGIQPPVRKIFTPSIIVNECPFLI